MTTSKAGKQVLASRHLNTYGPPIVVSPALPTTPSDVENIVRIVRHGLADVLAWLGEDIGPKPGDRTHAVWAEGTLFVSQELRDKLSDALDSPNAV